MKVRVPKEHRPPERFKPFVCLNYDTGRMDKFRVVGVYRAPKRGDWIWCRSGVESIGPHAHRASINFSKGNRYVILERVK